MEPRQGARVITSNIDVAEERARIRAAPTQASRPCWSRGCRALTVAL